SFVTPVPSANQGKLDVYAVSSQRASLWSYGLKGTNCTLTKIAESKACAIQAVNGLPNSAVVIGDVSRDPGMEAVALCTPAANAGFSFVVAPLVPAEANSLASSNLKLVMSPRARASTPVLADIDGNGKREIVFLIQPTTGSNTDVFLKIW